MSLLHQKYKGSDTKELKTEIKQLHFHAKAMGETMAKQQSHLHNLREDVQRTYQCLLDGQKSMAMTVLESALGIESSEEVE
jgi:hypothetical protein